MASASSYYLSSSTYSYPDALWSITSPSRFLVRSHFIYMAWGRDIGSYPSFDIYFPSSNLLLSQFPAYFGLPSWCTFSFVRHNLTESFFYLFGVSSIRKENFISFAGFSSDGSIFFSSKLIIKHFSRTADSLVERLNQSLYDHSALVMYNRYRVITTITGYQETEELKQSINNAFKFQLRDIICTE